MGSSRKTRVRPGGPKLKYVCVEETRPGRWKIVARYVDGSREEFDTSATNEESAKEAATLQFELDKLQGKWGYFQFGFEFDGNTFYVESGP